MTHFSDSARSFQPSRWGRFSTRRRSESARVDMHHRADLNERESSSLLGIARIWVLEFVGLMALCIVVVATRWDSLSANLIEKHGFRQTQTAVTAQVFHERGIDLVHPSIPVFGFVPSVPFEFPIYQAIATIPMSWGVDPTFALRATSLVFFCATVVALYFFFTQFVSRLAAGVATAWFAFNPYSHMWSRAVLIEYITLCFSIVMAVAAIQGLRTRKLQWIALATVAGTIAMLSKPTTAAFWFIPVALFPLVRDNSVVSWIRNRLRPSVVVAALVVVLPALVWTVYSDRVRGRYEATRWLTSDNLTEWNFGPPGLRFSPGFWLTINERITQLMTVVPFWIVLIAGAVAAARLKKKLVFGALVLTLFAPLVVFTNLHLVHDYYQVAIVGQVFAIVALVVEGIRQMPRRRARVLLAIGVVLCIVVVNVRTSGYAFGKHEAFPEGIGYTRAITNYAGPDEVIVEMVNDWSPEVAYYLHRSTFAIPKTKQEDPAYMALYNDERLKYLVTKSANWVTDGIMAQRPWSGVFEPHAYALGGAASPIDPRLRVLVAPSVPSALEITSTASPKTVSLKCDLQRNDLSRVFDLTDARYRDPNAWVVFQTVIDTPRPRYNKVHVVMGVGKNEAPVLGVIGMRMADVDRVACWEAERVELTLLGVGRSK